MERHCITTLKSSFPNAWSSRMHWRRFEHGARVITYAGVERLIVQNEQLPGVELSTGQIATASVIINAAGPWVDRILESADTVPRLIGGTKGSHIVVAPFTGAPKTAIYIEAKTDQRPFFIIPWNKNYLIGTTDIRYEGDLDNVRIDETEIEYLLRETNGVLPTANLQRERHSLQLLRCSPASFHN